MKIVDTMASEERTPRRRKYYSPEFKGQVVQECRRSGASVAGVALAHGINANIVHRWLREHAGSELAAPLPPTFVPVMLDQAMAPVGCPGGGAGADIRVEVRRGGSAVVVSWPLEGAASCAAWLREWLR